MTDLLARDNNSNNESFYMQINSNSDDGIVEFNSVTTEITSDGLNEFFTTHTEFSNEYGYTATYKIVFKKLNDDQFEIYDYGVININGESNSMENRGWFSDYGDCIGGVLDTDESLGQVITVLGIAGGVGCVPCGIAGGVIFGFAALGRTAV